MKYTLALFCLLSLSLFSCRQKLLVGEGNTGTQNRAATSAFDRIEISNALSATVTLNPAAPANISITGYENLLPHIKTEIRDKKLRIFVEEIYRLENSGDLRIEVTLPQLKKLAAQGASKIEVPAALRIDQLEVEASGASEIILAHVQIAHLKAEVSGASTLTLNSGSVSRLDAELSGSSELNAFGAQAANATLDVSGASTANATVLQTLQAEASGASSVHYKGSPQVKAQTSGAGSVNRAD